MGVNGNKLILYHVEWVAIPIPYTLQVPRAHHLSPRRKVSTSDAQSAHESKRNVLVIFNKWKFGNNLATYQ